MQRKLQWIISVDFDATSQKVQASRHLSDMILIKNDFMQRGALSPLLWNVTLEYGIKQVQVRQDGLKSSGTHQLVSYIDGVNTLD
jgi:hypothetical protein